MAKLYASTVCYVEKANKVLFIKFNNKHSEVYCPPGGKEEAGETPTECIIREFYEETGLKLVEPKLKGISYWQNGVDSGIIFFYYSDQTVGEVLLESSEGKLEWIDKSMISELYQFKMNEKLTEYMLNENSRIFEGKFIFEGSDLVYSSVRWI